MGEGPEPVFLLHGLLGSGRNLAGIGRRFVSRRAESRCFLVDLTGHGRSPPLPPAAKLSDLAEDLLALVRTEAKGKPACIVGHSLGGRVLLEAARLEPRSISAAVILDVSPGTIVRGAGGIDAVVSALLLAPSQAESRMKMRAALAQAGLQEAMIDWLAMNLVAVEGGVRWRIDRDAIAALAVSSRQTDLWAPVEDGAVPMACVRGRRSPFVSDADLARFAKAGAEVREVDAGHFLHADAPDETFDAIVSALSSLRRA